MYLFFDTETTGLPKNWKAPITDFDNWPRLVQLAWLLYDQDGNKIDERDSIIKPMGFIIPSRSSEIHGITTQKAIWEGLALVAVLKDFLKSIKKAEYLVAHNISFDEMIMGAEFLRNNMPNPLPDKKKICTMRGSRDFCALNGSNGYKWPKLAQLYYKLFNIEFEDAHNAAADIKATAKCFWELKKQGIL